MVDFIITKPITAQDLEALDSQKLLVEVVNGDLREKEMAGENHGFIEFKVIMLLGSHIVAHKLGRVYTGDTTYVLKGTPQKIEVSRMPDVSFVKAERVIPSPGYHYLAPDLAIEIVSPSEATQDLADKIHDYLTYGTSQVWAIYPDEKKVIVHTAEGTTTTYHEQDTLTAEGVIPGLSFVVGSLFIS